MNKGKNTNNYNHDIPDLGQALGISGKRLRDLLDEIAEILAEINCKKHSSDSEVIEAFENRSWTEREKYYAIYSYARWIESRNRRFTGIMVIDKNELPPDSTVPRKQMINN